MNYFHDQNCLVCLSKEKKTIFSDLEHSCNVLQKSQIPLDNKEVLTDVLECSNCGHRYLAKSLSNEILNFYYNEVETEYYDFRKSNPVDHRPADTLKFAKYIDNNTHGNRILEIGSGLGFLLSRLKEMGNDCYGVEPSSFASLFSKEQFGLNVITGLLTENTFVNLKFDAVILSDVIEHVPEIDELFVLIKKYLADDGKVFVLTGDSKSLYAKLCGKKWLYMYSWEHISFFNKSSIKFLFNKHFLELEEFKRIPHSGSFFSNSVIFIKTIGHVILNKLRIRHNLFYSMSFDHFIAIGKNKSHL